MIQHMGDEAVDGLQRRGHGLNSPGINCGPACLRTSSTFPRRPVSGNRAGNAARRLKIGVERLVAIDDGLPDRGVEQGHDHQGGEENEEKSQEDNPPAIADYLPVIQCVHFSLGDLLSHSGEDYRERVG